MDIKKAFGAKIKELRTKKGITQSRLAELAGIDPKHMSHIETGRSFPKADLIEKFARALEVDYTEFFKAEDKQRKMTLDKINSYLEKATDEELKIIGRIIFTCLG